MSVQIQEENDMTPDEWNEKHSIGQKVTVLRDTGEITETTTRSDAFYAQSGAPVIHCVGISGYYHLSRVLPVPDCKYCNDEGFVIYGDMEQPCSACYTGPDGAL